MKKLLVFSLALALVLAFTLPASALESVFGGYWRTRAFSQQRYSGQDDSAQDLSRVDTRTRLYYTAILNDNLKFVNKFEFDAVWGDTGYGDIGTDGVSVEVKHTFADFNVGPLRFTVGAQGHVLARGFIFDDDYCGVTASYKAGDNLVPFTWARINEGNTGHNSRDADMFALWPVFKLGESLTLNPYFVYVYSDNTDPRANNYVATSYSLTEAADALGIEPGVNSYADDAKIYWLGLDVNATLGSFNLWGTGIYQGGETGDYDVKAFMVAGGASVPVGPVELHGQAFYASGDDDWGDDDDEEFFGTNGQSYYWSEIMGYGIFDNQVSAGSPGNKIGNIWAANIGATLKPIEKLSLTGDIWYASHVEDDIITDEKKLGIEVDLVATYQLVEGLNLDLVGAYLFADDATNSLDGVLAGDDNNEDPWEVGTRLSLSF